MAARPDKTLIILRHAHRDTTNRWADNGLSDKGKRQAQAIARHYVRAFSASEKPLLLTSPKRRCMETILAVARVANADVETTPLLLEQSEEETGRRFMGRVTEFCDWWLSSAPGFTIVCSHGDWIPVAVERLTGARARLDKGSWTQITVTAGKVRLEYLIQGFLQKKKEATGKISRGRS